jgi:hypothetical protein
MRLSSSLATTFVVASVVAAIGCGGANGKSVYSGARGAPKNPSPDGGPGGSNAPEGPPTQLSIGTASLSGVTSDGWAVFRATDVLKGANIVGESAAQDITNQPGNVLVRGRVVFNWANVDWTANVGDLSVWTSDTGTHRIGITTYSEGLVAASEQGVTIAYTANLKNDTMDLMIAPSDLSAPQVLIAAVGRGSETTCGPSMGFVGERLFVGWCTAGNRTGKIQRFENAAGTWTPTTIAEDALPAWSADSSGDRVFYQSSNYSGNYAQEGETHVIDAGVSSGIMLPDGSAVLYTVGDQLRRTGIPDVNPLSVVTRGYSQAAEYSRAFDQALYSTTVTYDNGTRRDLRVARTDQFNPAPTELVPDPVAELPRSAFTKDGRFVLYLTDVTPTGGTLHVRSIDGDERLVLNGVVDVVAAHDSTIVFTDGSSDPDVYPVVTDLKLLDVATSSIPALIEPKIAEGRTFQLDASGSHVVYVRSGVDRDASAAREGLFVQAVP